MGGPNEYLIDRCVCVCRARGAGIVKELVETGIYCQTCCDDYSIHLAMDNGWIEGRYALVRVGDSFVACGGCALDDLARQIISSGACGFFVRTYRIHDRL